jgi:hypothetical protein
MVSRLSRVLGRLIDTDAWRAAQGFVDIILFAGLKPAADSEKSLPRPKIKRLPALPSVSRQLESLPSEPQAANINRTWWNV